MMSTMDDHSYHLLAVSGNYGGSLVVIGKSLLHILQNMLHRSNFRYTPSNGEPKQGEWSWVGKQDRQ